MDLNETPESRANQISNTGTSSHLYNHLTQCGDDELPTGGYDPTLFGLTGSSTRICPVYVGCRGFPNGCPFVTCGDHNSSNDRNHVEVCRFVNDYNVSVTDDPTSLQMAKYVLEEMCQPDLLANGAKNPYHYFNGNGSDCSCLPNSDMYSPAGQIYSGVGFGRNYFHTAAAPHTHEECYLVYQRVRNDDQLRIAFLNKLAATLLDRSRQRGL